MKFLSRIIVKLGCLLGISACAHPLPTVREAGDPSRELSARVAASPQLAVLFVGNSYSFGVPRAFSKLAAERGKSVRTGHATSGGWTLARHAKSEGTLRKIRSGGWDIVVLQEQSLIPALPPRQRSTQMDPPLQQLVTEIRAAGAIPVLYQTWGRRDGDPSRRGDDFAAMNARLRAGYQAAAAAAGGVVIVPVGDYWEKPFLPDQLFIEDGSHPTRIGDERTAEAFFDTIFGK